MDDCERFSHCELLMGHFIPIWTHQTVEESLQYIKLKYATYYQLQENQFDWITTRNSCNSSVVSRVRHCIPGCTNINLDAKGKCILLDTCEKETNKKSANDEFGQCINLFCLVYC